MVDACNVTSNTLVYSLAVLYFCSVWSSSFLLVLLFICESYYLFIKIALNFIVEHKFSLLIPFYLFTYAHKWEFVAAFKLTQFITDKSKGKERERERNRVNIDRNAKWMRHITKQLAPKTSTFFGYSGWWWYVCYAVTLCVSQLWCEFVATKRRDVSFVSFLFRIFIITLKVYLCVTWFSMYSGWHFIQVNVIRKLSEIFKVLVPWDILYFRLRSSSLFFCCFILSLCLDRFGKDEANARIFLRQMPQNILSQINFHLETTASIHIHTHGQIVQKAIYVAWERERQKRDTAHIAAH